MDGETPVDRRGSPAGSVTPAHGLPASGPVAAARDRVLAAHARLLRSWLDETLVRSRRYDLTPRWDVLASALSLLGPAPVRTRLELDALALDLVALVRERVRDGRVAASGRACCEYGRAGVGAILACLAVLDRAALPAGHLEDLAAWLGGAVATHVRHLAGGDWDREEARSLADALARLHALPVPAATCEEVSRAVASLNATATAGAGLTLRPLLALMIATAWFEGEIRRPELRPEGLHCLARGAVPVAGLRSAPASARSPWVWSSPRNYGGLLERITPPS